MSGKNSRAINIKNIKGSGAQNTSGKISSKTGSGRIQSGFCKNEGSCDKISISPYSQTGSRSAQNACNPDIYRKAVDAGNYLRWLVNYKNSDIFISSDKDIKDKIKLPLEKIYSKLEYCITRDPVFLKSLVPVTPKSYYPEEIKTMCRLSQKFNTGPMAAVAGTVNDYLAGHLLQYCSSLIIENGGDLYINSGSDTVINLYLKNPYFNNKINIMIKKADTPCGICSSSGTFGHSLSMGKCDLATILAGTSAEADAAATAAANSVICESDIEASIDYFRTFESIYGILLIKDKKIGMWGKFQLVE